MRYAKISNRETVIEVSVYSLFSIITHTQTLKYKKVTHKNKISV